VVALDDRRLPDGGHSRLGIGRLCVGFHGLIGDQNKQLARSFVAKELMGTERKAAS
jgi:hypothetical protein